MKTLGKLLAHADFSSASESWPSRVTVPKVATIPMLLAGTDMVATIGRRAHLVMGGFCAAADSSLHATTKPNYGFVEFTRSWSKISSRSTGA